MEHMKIRMESKTPFSSVFTADQLWAHFVWAISDMHGEVAALDFVRQFESFPPFLCSAMQPEGYLPKPILPPPTNDTRRIGNEDIAARRKAKRNKKYEWLPISLFRELQKDIAQYYLFDEIKQPGKIGTIQENKVSINRLSGTAEQLYSSRYVSSDNSFVMYIAFLQDKTQWESLLLECLDYLEKMGIGGDRNVGRGKFSLEYTSLNANESALFSFRCESFMTLSRCSGNDLLPYSYRLTVYSGMVSRPFVFPDGTPMGINKKPVLGYEPGSIFLGGRGRMVNNVYPNSDVCSYGYAFPVPLPIGEEK